MAIYGKFAGPIKDTLGKQSITCISNTNVATVITHPDQTGSTSSRLVTMVITSSGNATLEINGGATLGARGNVGSRTVTVKKYVS